MQMRRKLQRNYFDELLRLISLPAAPHSTVYATQEITSHYFLCNPWVSASDRLRERGRERHGSGRERSLNWHACLFWFAAALSNWMSMETGSENWMHNNNNASELSEARRGEFARSFVRLEVATQTETINSNWRLSKPALQAARQQRERAESERGVGRERCIERELDDGVATSVKCRRKEARFKLKRA